MSTSRACLPAVLLGGSAWLGRPYNPYTCKNGMSWATLREYSSYSDPYSCWRYSSSVPIRILKHINRHIETEMIRKLSVINAIPGTINTMNAEYIGFRENLYTPFVSRWWDSNAFLICIIEENQNHNPTAFHTKPIMRSQINHSLDRLIGRLNIAWNNRVTIKAKPPTTAIRGPILKMFIL